MGRLNHQFVHIEGAILIPGLHGLDEDARQAVLRRVSTILDTAYANVEALHGQLLTFTTRDEKYEIDIENYELAENDGLVEVILDDVATLPLILYATKEIAAEALCEVRSLFHASCKVAARANGFDPSNIRYFRCYARRHVESVQTIELHLPTA